MSDPEDKHLRAVPPLDSADDDVPASADEVEAELEGELEEEVDLAEGEAPLTRRARFRRRGIYLLPNLITSGALFAGFMPSWPG